MALIIPLVDTGQIAMVAVAVVFGSIATLAVGLRLLAARMAHRRLDASDYCILVAWLFTLGLMVVCILEAVLGGFGWHEMDLLDRFGPETIVQYHKIILPLELLWNLSLTATKLSVLLFYVRVFAVTSICLPAKIIMVFVALLGTSGFLSSVLICRPFAYNWDLSIRGGHCGSQSAVFAVFGIMNLVTDVTVLTLPISSLLSLRMPIWKKAWLLGTFTMGFVTCIASIVRLVYLAKIDYNDVTYTSVTAVLMTAVEPSLAVMLACIPLLRPLLGPQRRLTSAERPAGERKRFSTTWMSTTWSRSKTFISSHHWRSGAIPRGGGAPAAAAMTRLGSSDVQLGYSTRKSSGIIRSAIVGASRSVLNSIWDDDSDDAVELRFVLSPAEGVSNFVHVEASPARGDGAVEAREGDEVIRGQIRDVEAGNKGWGGGGMTITVKKEWNVEHEPKSPP